jgi:allophanate hydrolase
VAETIAAIVDAHRAGTMAPEQTVARSFSRIRARDDAAIFISLRDEREALSEARRVISEGPAGKPLFGVPVAVKDNIDVAGLPTTAACPAFAYKPDRDAVAVARLRQAGAIIIGKTNLDQFATGLVGTRSPYGTPRNVFDPKLIPGGSSSGSAVAVAAGLVPVALGTDTAGSGRVPAALGNIVGLKPSVGLVPTLGVVPACRTLDCVSVFSLTVDDAWTTLAAIAGPDAGDPFSRRHPLAALGSMPPGVRLGVPGRTQRVFFDDKLQAAAYEDALERLARLGAAIVEIDMEPFYATARLLYEGPWLAERTFAAGELLAKSPEALFPVTCEIIQAGTQASAIDAFAAFYRLTELRHACEQILATVDALALPTMPTIYTVADVIENPITLNSRLGTYTNFVNMLDLCGLALPAAMRGDGAPFGVTLLAHAGSDAFLASIGRVFHADTGLPLGAIGEALPPLPDLPAMPAPGEAALAVVGAHLSGMPLNADLRALGARLLQRTTTTADYRLYALAATDPPKPGLLRVAARGRAIEVEIWALPLAAFGRFVEDVPPPLTIGTVRLADGREVRGFLCEAAAVKDARDISDCGGWRAYVAQSAVESGFAAKPRAKKSKSSKPRTKRQQK